MANLKDLKTRIKSVKATQKITSAMKMVAAAKFKRAQENVEAARPYANRMQGMVGDLAGQFQGDNAPILLKGSGKNDKHLLVVLSADRGLCGGFNSNIIRAARLEAERYTKEGKTLKLLMVGRKAADALRREYGDKYVDAIEGIQGTNVSFDSIQQISTKIQELLAEGEIDTCSILFNRFQSALTQIVSFDSLVPAQIPDSESDSDNATIAPKEYEPDESSVLDDLLPRALSTQIFISILESSVSELGARMTAMDNATRNAGDLIDQLTMEYNRTRQAAITTELIEIISGAEAL